jgi:C4-dicarboxylate-specific signal transduction histidine kinase
MLPNSVLHKRNGHRHLPRPASVSTGDLVRLVHSAPGRSADLSADVLKFAMVLQSESSIDAWEELGGDGPSHPSPLGRALARGREALERGELEDVRSALDALQSRADVAAEVIARLTEVIQISDARPYRTSSRYVVSLNDLVIETLGLLAGRSPWIAAVSTRLDAALPSVAGDPRQLKEALVILVVTMARANRAANRSGMITVETSHQDGVLRGEQIVRLSISDDGAAVDLQPTRAEPTPAAPAEMDLYRVARIVKEHGGAFSATPLASGGMCFTVELPAV